MGGLSRMNQGLLLTAGLLCIGLVSYVVSQTQTNKNDDALNAVSLVDTKTLSSLATSTTAIDTSHLADGLTPPTNKWFSGFALQKKPEPGFFYPGSFRPTNTGFELSLPTVTTNAKLVIGPHTPGLEVTLASADSYQITAYDELTVTMTYFNGSEPLADVRIGSGLPYVYLTSRTKNLEVSFSGEATGKKNGTLISVLGKVYGLNVASDANRFSLENESNATFFVLPKATDFEALQSHASARVDSATVSYSQAKTSSTTEFTYKTSNNKPTMFVRLPHQNSKKAKPITSYPSVLGALGLESGTTLNYTVPRTNATQSLDIDALSEADKNKLRTQLLKDITTLPPAPEDTYFGGKQLQRTAQLLDIAAKLGDEASKQLLQKRLSADLEAWLKPGQKGLRSFQYVPDMKGIVGSKASFGSDTQFNDHHFHYGYFITSAAILAKYDDGFDKAHGSMINLLVADIANYKTNEQLPLRRNYDAYAGHSWASGTSPFADGNNQESTSEAINAWSGVANWAAVTKNDALQQEAEWMLSNEYDTAQQYWLLRGDRSQTVSADYTSPIVSLLWGGKREYATFFSDEANAKLAIQLLPVTPTLQTAGLQLTEKELTGTDVSKQYGDTILMVSPGANIEKAMALPDTAIDDGNSRTYMYAYILTSQK